MTAGPQAMSTATDPTLVRGLLLRRVSLEADGVISLQLVDPSGADLPAWEAGAHLELLLPSGLVRQYSLCGDPSDRSSYTVAVLEEPEGRGGSREVHASALVGTTVRVRGPRNHFPLVPAVRYLFVAGGIGITPLLAMARTAEAAGVPWSMVYGGRSRRSMAFVPELAALGEDRLELVPQDELGLPDLEAVLDAAGPGTQVYCCGPEGLIAAVEQRCRVRGIDEVLHVERFGAAPATGDGEGEQEATTFEVELRRSGLTLTVPADRTLIDVVRERVPEVMTSCEEGFCGTCETRVLEGVPEHHDTILSAAERAKGTTMMICVGRSASARLVLDL